MRKTGLLLALALGAAQASEPAEVRIRDYRFTPERVVVKAGATVKWTNDEKRASHSVLFPAEKLESERLLNGDAWERRFDRPGLYPYTCEPHPEMKGVVEVLP
jgi:plastocyanin